MQTGYSRQDILRLQEMLQSTVDGQEGKRRRPHRPPPLPPTSNAPRNVNILKEKLLAEGLTLAAPAATKAPADDGDSEEEQDVVYMSLSKDSDTLIIRGGTLQALIDKLLVEGKAYEEVFLITYRSFIQPMDLFEGLVVRFGAAAEMYPDDQSARTRMELKVLSVIRQWLDKHFDDWVELSMFQLLEEWLRLDVMSAHAKVAQQFLEMIEKKKARHQSKGSIEHQFDHPPPKSLRMPATWKTVCDLDALEVARQLCIIESRLFQAITPKEFLGKGWESKKKDAVAPNLSAFIAHFNRVSSWVATTVIEAASDSQRTSIVEFWIGVSDALLDLNNFNGIMEIMGGLGATSVARLKKLWGSISKAKTKAWDRVRAVMAPQASFSSYRAAIRTAHPPVVPYVGVYMQDIVFIEDGNPDFLKDRPNWVNFHKRRLLADVIRDLQQYGQSPYNLLVVDELATVINHAHVEKEDVLYAKSLQLQPRSE